MEMGTDDYREQLQALGQEFTDLLPSRLDDIETRWDGLTEGGWDRDQLLGLIRAVRVLSGAGKTFGYADLGRAAIALEKRLKAWLELEKPPAEGALDHVSALVGALRPAAGHRSEASRLRSLRRMAHEDEEGRLIYLVEDDQELAKDLRLQLFNFGYKVRIFDDGEGVAEAIAERRPDALVVDIVLGEDHDAGLDLMRDLERRLDLRDSRWSKEGEEQECPGRGDHSTSATKR